MFKVPKANTHDLPLAWTRLVVLTTLLSLSILSSALVIKMFERHAHDQNDVKKYAPAGVTVEIKYNEIQTAGILVYLSSMLVTTIVGHILIMLLQDMYNLVRFAPPSAARLVPSFLRRLNFVTGRYSTTTLHYQAGLLLLSLVLFTLPVAFFTSFIYTGTMGIIVNPGSMLPSDAEVAVQAELQFLGITTSYRHIPYIRTPPLASWPAVGFLVISSIITLVAWRLRPRLVPELPAEILLSENEKKPSDQLEAALPSV